MLRWYFVYVYFLFSTCCIIVTWWGGPGGIEVWSLGPLLPSVLWHCWLGHFVQNCELHFILYYILLKSAISAVPKVLMCVLALSLHSSYLYCLIVPYVLHVVSSVSVIKWWWWWWWWWRTDNFATNRLTEQRIVWDSDWRYCLLFSQAGDRCDLSHDPLNSAVGQRWSCCRYTRYSVHMCLLFDWRTVLARL